MLPTPDHTLFELVGPYRYLSPISIAETTLSSILGRGLTLGKYEQAQRRHPLPARPPVDVCVNSGRPDFTPTAVVEVLSEPPPVVSEAYYPSTRITDKLMQPQYEEPATQVDPSILHLDFSADCTRTPADTFTGCRRTLWRATQNIRAVRVLLSNSCAD